MNFIVKTLMFICFCSVGLSVARERPPFRYPVPAGVQTNLLNWFENETGKPDDILGDAPLIETLPNFTNVSVGMKSWVTPSVQAAISNAYLWDGIIDAYSCDIENWEYTPVEERTNLIWASSLVRNLCDSHTNKFGIKWWAGFGAMYIHRNSSTNIGQFYDTWAVQCQKFQRASVRSQTTSDIVAAFANLKTANPSCAFGIQLGMSTNYGGQGETGVEAAFELYKMTRPFCDFYAFWWPPDINDLKSFYSLAMNYEHNIICPAAPTGINAAFDLVGIKIEWNKSSETNIAGYCIAKSFDGKPFSRINIPVIETNYYTDINITNDIIYYYKVAALNISNEISDYSSSIEVFVPEPGFYLSFIIFYLLIGGNHDCSKKNIYYCFLYFNNNYFYS